MTKEYIIQSYDKFMELKGKAVAGYSIYTPEDNVTAFNLFSVKTNHHEEFLDKDEEETTKEIFFQEMLNTETAIEVNHVVNDVYHNFIFYL